MAKKKSTPAVKSSPVARRKNPKSAAAKKTRAKTAASKAKKPRQPTAKSVDGILKAFDKERVAQNSNLTSTRKRIERLTKQVNSIKTELENLKRKAIETEIAIETLDTRRDAEIGTLLSGMGIDLNKAAAAAKPKAPVQESTPLFDSPVKGDETEPEEKKPEFSPA